MKRNFLQYISTPGVKPIIGFILYISIIISNNTCRWVRLPISIGPGTLEVSIIAFQVFITWFVGELTIAIMKRQSLLQQSSNRIQKDNIKLQMFDKRYAVYEAIVESLAVAGRQDYSDYLLSGNTNPFAINKLMSDANSNLNKQTLLSEALFDKNIYNKVKNINSEFDKITKLHFSLYKQNLKLRESNPLRFAKFGELFAETALATTAEEMEICNKNIEKEFPDIYKTIVEFNAAVAYYSLFIEKSGVQNDFDTYLKINNIDK